MAIYKISNEAKEDLIRIHQYGLERFGEQQADKYFESFFESFFECFETIAENPFAFEPIDYIGKGYRRCPCGADSIYFKTNDNGVVEIMAIIGRQDLENLT